MSRSLPLLRTSAILFLGLSVVAAVWMYSRGSSLLPQQVQSKAARPRPVFPAGATPCVRLLDLRVAPGSAADANELTLIATVQYEGPRAETIDLTGLAFSVETLCLDARSSALAKVEDPPDAIVCRGLIRFGQPMEPYVPLVVAFGLGSRRVSATAALGAFGAIRLSENMIPESQVPTGSRHKYIDLTVGSDLRAQEWEGPSPQLSGCVTVIPTDGSEPFEPPALPEERPKN